MNRYLLVLVSFLIFIIGIGCAAAADLDSGIADDHSLTADDSISADDDVQLSKWYGDDRRLYAQEGRALYSDDDAKLSKWYGDDKRLYAQEGRALYSDDDAKLSKWYGDDRRVFGIHIVPQYLDQQHPTPYDPKA